MILYKLALTFAWVGVPLFAVGFALAWAAGEDSTRYKRSILAGALGWNLSLLAAALYISHQIGQVWS